MLVLMVCTVMMHYYSVGFGDERKCGHKYMKIPTNWETRIQKQMHTFCGPL